MMQKKILSFVVNEGRFLALRNNPHPEHGGDFWFIVTGILEENESYEDAVRREVKEETNLEVNKILSLNWGSIYEWAGVTCEELNYISFIIPGEIILNEENIEYEWLELNEFIERIRWDDDKELLKLVLKKALNKEVFFKKLTIKDYRVKSNN